MIDPNKTLNVTVGETLQQAGARAVTAMQAAQAGRQTPAYFGISFSQIGDLLSTFTPKRWELIAALRATGPSTVAGLARQLGRDYKNVHTDVQQLIEWLAIERGDDGRVSVPWGEIVVDLKLPQQQAV